MLNIIRRLLLAVICGVPILPAMAQPGLPGGIFPIGGATPSQTPGQLNTGCESNQGTGCGDRSAINHLDVCFDGDQDGVCDEDDECLDTPENTPVFFNGCHLQEGKAIVMRGVNFEFDRAELTPESRPILERAVEVLQGQPDVLVTVDGHTDSIGSHAYNEQLSWRRVRTVYTFFINMGVDPARLAYRGFGETKPIAANQNPDGTDNPAGRAANRRVELNVLDPLTFQAIKEESGGRFDNIEPGAPVPMAQSRPEPKPEPVRAPVSEPVSEPEPAADAATVAEEPTASEPEAPADDGYDAYIEGDNDGDTDSYADFADEFADDSVAEDDNESGAADTGADTPSAPADADSTSDAGSGDDVGAEDYMDEFGDYGDSDNDNAADTSAGEADAESAADAEADSGDQPAEAVDDGADDEPYDYSQEFDY